MPETLAEWAGAVVFLFCIWFTGFLVGWGYGTRVRKGEMQ